MWVGAQECRCPGAGATDHCELCDRVARGLIQVLREKQATTLKAVTSLGAPRLRLFIF